MSRIAFPLLVCAAMLPIFSGCKHMAEKRAIDQFMTAVETDDLATLKALSSTQFEQKALRRDESLEELDRLRLPAGEVEIVEVKDESETEKLVTVEIGESKRRLFYRLTKSPETKKWVIDDLYIRQRKDGLKIDKAVTEQMDLLLTILDFRDAWSSDDPDRILAVTAPELHEILSAVPRHHLLQLTQKVFPEKNSDLRMRNPQLDNEVAMVTFNRPAGKMIVTFKLLEVGWRVNDLAVESRTEGDHIPSLQKMAIAMHAAFEFLDAYAQGDKTKLKELCDPRFYGGSIGPGDLSLVQLPAGELPAKTYQLKMRGQRADLIIARDSDTITISLTRPDAVQPDAVGVPLKYLVNEVTIYESVAGRAAPREKRLSAVFTGRAVSEIYAEALAARDLSTLSRISTTDFQNRAWSKFADRDLERVQVLNFQPGPFEVLAEKFEGAVTELTVQQGAQTVTYVLRDCDGEIRVDDVLVQADKQGHSLKDTLEILAPIHTFASALAGSEIGTLQRTSSSDFNRIVWRQVRDVPHLGRQAVPHLYAPLSGVQRVDDKSLLVALGDEQFGAKVLLIEEHAQNVIHEILLVAGPADEQQARLKGTLRTQIANGLLASGVQPVAHEAPAEPLPGAAAIEPAVFEQEVAPPMPLEPSDAAFLPPPEMP